MGFCSSSETYINVELLGNIGKKEEGLKTNIIDEDSEKYALISSFFRLPWESIQFQLFYFSYHFFLQALCDIKVVITETLIYASILTIVAFTIER